MKNHVFLNTGGSIMKNKSNQTKNSPFLNTNSSRYLSTMNNKSLSTNESATAFT